MTSEATGRKLLAMSVLLISLINFSLLLGGIFGHVSNILLNLTAIEIVNNTITEIYNTFLLSDNLFPFPVSLQNMMTFEDTYKIRKNKNNKYIFNTARTFSFSFGSTGFNLSADYFYGYSSRMAICNRKNVLEVKLDGFLNDIFNCSCKVTGFVGRFFVMNTKIGQTYYPDPDVAFHTTQNKTGFLVIGRKKKLMFDNILNYQLFSRECFADKNSLRLFVYIGICVSVIIILNISISLPSMLRKDRRVHPRGHIRQKLNVALHFKF